jgi:hypothetical protein
MTGRGRSIIGMCVRRRLRGFALGRGDGSKTRHVDPR